ncbi:hypothetical protein L2E82_08159 [Cichorium intybus]|uniref:Uncharacterized protein n=1 Tax=Cichorium intybus TaxID=13427 RepID=A0ACB9G6T5_CICIN|nr:hypothetical protein L2E82_08159 [Cichorium intybus]
MVNHVLETLIKQLLYDYDRARVVYRKRLYWKRKKHESLELLVNHLKKMMLGYENEEVEGLINKMEVLAGRIDSLGYLEGGMDSMLEIVEELCNIRFGSNIEEETVVGFDDDVVTLLDELTQASIKRLQVISIVGMAGLEVYRYARALISSTSSTITRGVMPLNLPALTTHSGLIPENDGCGSGLSSLQTLSQVSPQSCHNILSWTPNLRKLGFCGPLISSQGDLEFPNTGSLQNLHELKLLNTVTYPDPARSCNPVMFPEMLKKLTLSNIGMDWEEMWTFSLLPNLEILKLKFNACIGEKWETGDAEFGRLKILKLQGLELKEWVCWRDNFPCLQRSVVHHCLKLKSIPLEVGRILTLEVIEVRGCSMSAKASALKIKEEQESEGNSFLNVHATNDVFGTRSMRLGKLRKY